ncbi:MAG: DUF2752 domain-containing protein [bacterium]
MPSQEYGPRPGLIALIQERPEDSSLFWSRYLLLFLPVIFLSFVILAGRLNPESTGVGTHRQLGLPACLVMERTGLPCPTCGMTTALANLGHGRIIDSWKCSPALVLMATLGGLVSVWATMSFLKSRLIGFRSWDRPLELWAGGMFAIALTTWLIRAAQWRLLAGF